MRIRSESSTDAAAVRAVNEAAFGSATEADIVERLGKRPEEIVSLVAESGGRLVGHILFSPVELAGHTELRLMGLGPMSVLPAFQRQGFGSALVREGLSRCRRKGYRAVVVLGHPDYYPRFGFVPASRFGIKSAYDVPDEVFMALELEPGALRGAGGLVTYSEAFSGA